MPSTPPPFEGLARKYCFRASVRIMNRARVPVGIFVGYDTKPTIARDVEHAGTSFCIEQPEYRCDDVQLILHEECPVELSNEIYFQPFESFDGSVRQEP